MLSHAILLFAAASMLHAQTAADSSSILSDLRSGNYVEAKRLLDQALVASPNDARLWTLDGFALLHLGSEKAALASYKRALQISPDYLAALEGAAELEYKASDQAAVPLLEKILRIHPGDETSHAMLAALAYRRGDCETAVKEFSECQPVMSLKARALEQDGACLVKLRRAVEAIPVFQKIVELDPENNGALYNLAVVESLAGRYQDVIGTLTGLLNWKPSDADSLDLLAEAYEAVSDTPRAVAALRQAIVAAPDVPRYYVDFANISLVHISYQVGIDMVTAGLKRVSDSAPLYLARGVLYVQIGKFDEAEKDFARAEELDPNSESGSVAQGLAAVQRNDLAHAEATVRARLAKTPGDAFLYYLLGDILVRRGAAPGSAQFSEALACAKKAVQLQPKLALGRDLLGRLYLEEGKTDQAIDESRLAFQGDPTDQTALYHLILALRKGNRSEEVQPLLRKLAELLQQARLKEAAEHKYALIETGPGDASR